MAEQEMAAEGQAEGQAQSAVADGQQSVEGAQQQDDGQYVRIPRANYAKLAPDGDFNKVVHMANQYRELDQGGYVQLAARAGEMNMDGYLLTNALMTPEEDRTGAQQQAVDQAAQQAQQQAGQQGQYVTMEQAEEMARRAAKAELQEYRATETKASAKQQAASREQAAFADALKELGYESNPQDFDLGGSTQKLDPAVDLVYRSALQSTVQRLHESRLNRNDPEYADKLYGPVAPELVREAANIIKPILATLGQQSQVEAAVSQAALPSGSVATGPSGRAQRNVEDMSPDERKAAALARAEKRGVFAKG